MKVLKVKVAVACALLAIYVINVYKSFRVTVCKTVHHMLSDRCLSCLSATLVYCGQTVGRIKMKLGTQVGLSPGHIALYGDPGPPPPKGHSPPFGPCLLCPYGWMDQDATWYGGRPRSKRHCVRWGPSSPSPKRGRTPFQFSAYVYCGQTTAWIKMPLRMEIGWMDQDATWVPI